jgi:hypothetical protein
MPIEENKNNNIPIHIKAKVQLYNKNLKLFFIGLKDKFNLFNLPLLTNLSLTY